MRATRFNIFKRFRRDDRGVTLVEYGIGIALAIFIGAAVFIPVLATDIGDAMDAAGAEMVD